MSVFDFDKKIHTMEGISLKFPDLHWQYPKVMHIIWVNCLGNTRTMLENALGQKITLELTHL